MPCAWFQELPIAITVCDENGTILEMNDRSRATFAKDGGAALIGRSVLDCHPPAARARFEALLATHTANFYTIEKQGRRKLIAQVPWTEGGEARGLVELSIELPAELPHFVRG